MYKMTNDQIKFLDTWQETILRKHPVLERKTEMIIRGEDREDFDKLLRSYLELLYASVRLGFAYDLGWLCREVVGISTEETAVIVEEIDAHVKADVMVDIDECLTAVKQLLLNWEEVMIQRGRRQVKQEDKPSVLSVPDNQLRFPFD